MDLQAAVLGLSPEGADHAPAEGEWPVRRVYGHILGTDIIFSAVVRYALEQHRGGTWTPEEMSDEDESRLIGMNEDRYKTLVRSSLGDMQAFHRKQHSDILNRFSSITDDELNLPVTFWEETRFPIRHRLHRFEAHIVQHTVQIDKTLATIGLAPSEPKRLIRYLYAVLAQAESALIGADKIPAKYEELAQSIQTRSMEIQKNLK